MKGSRGNIRSPGAPPPGGSSAKKKTKPKSPSTRSTKANASPEQTPKKRKGKWSKERKAERKRLRAMEAGEDISVIDMTALESDGEEPVVRAAKAEAARRESYEAARLSKVVPPPTARKEKRRRTEEAGEAGPGPSTLLSRSEALGTPSKRDSEDVYTPTNFRPMKRSMASVYTGQTPSPPPKSAPPGEAGARLTADIVIEEKPIASASGDNGDKTGVSAHFDPPGLFSSSLVPTAADLPTKSSTSSKSAEPAHVPLLLPSHVEVDEIISQGSAAVAAEKEAQIEESKQSMEGLFVFDTDVAKGVTRYFDPDAEEEPQGEEATFLATADQSKICQNCKKPGHKPRDCPHIICTTCGEMDSHERRDCPYGVTCFSCGLRGHRINDCPNPASKSARRQGCSRCGNRDHKDNSCPSLWRIYVYHTAAARQSILSEKRKETGWAKEAVGGDTYTEYCYNCARQGHLGDDCQARRGSLARLSTPSAFSYRMSNAGPFTSVPSRAERSSAPSTHRRFSNEEESQNNDSVLPGLAKPFAGLDAGRKSRDKAKQKAVDLEVISSDDDDFLHGQSSSRGGNKSRGRGWMNGPRSTPNNHPGRRAWDSEHREKEREGNNRPGPGGSARSRKDGNNMPFSHSHLMSPTSTPASAPANPKGIFFGNITGVPGRPDSPTPHSSSYTENTLGGGGDWKSRASKALTSRAMGFASAPNSRSRSPVPSPLGGSQNGDSDTPRKKRRRQENVIDQGRSDREFEEEWRGKGNGGGNVKDWGKMDDEADRKERRDAEREGKKYKGDGGSRYGSGSGAGGRGGGVAGRGGAGSSRSASGPWGRSGEDKQGGSKSVGQKYTGGY